MDEPEEHYTEESLLKAKTFLFMMLIEKNAEHNELMTAADIDLGFALSHDPKILEMVEKLKGE
jgi:hypothetical protein